MKPKEIAFVCYGVTDLAKSREFYEKALGLEAENVWMDEASGMGMIEYGLGPNNTHTLAIGSGAENFKPGLHGGTVALEVEDFDKAVETLRAANVTFTLEPMEYSVCHMAAFLDLDGNQLMVHMRK